MRRAALVAALTLVLSGCPDADAPDPSPSPTAAPPVWKGPPPPAVVEACARCHAFPPADSLPRARWAKLVPEMATMPGPTGVTPLSPAEVNAAADYYLAAAPAALPAIAKGPPTSTHAKRYVIEHFTPRGLEKRRIPATANVTFARLSDRPGQELLAAELRARSVFLLRAGKGARMVPLQSNLNYPCHVSTADLDNDGQLDLLIASLGDMNPTNAKKGSIHALLRRGKRFERKDLATGLGRVADLVAADLDGDDDLDLVAAVFGWRGPGQLLLYERTGEALTFTARELDPRDGWIHVAPTDLDGDGDLDLVALLSQEHEQVLAFVNQGKLRFTPRVLYRAPHPAWGFSGLELVDLDRDGDQDVLLSNGDALDDDLLKPYHGVSWLENVSTPKEIAFTHHRIANDLPGCERAVAGDLDGDGDLDVVAVTFLPQHSPASWKQHDLSSVVWIERTKAGWSLHPIEKHRCIHPTVALGDHDGDGKLDIAVGNYVWITGPGGQTKTPSDYLTVFRAR